jgi:hypothetical protein
VSAAAAGRGAGALATWPASLTRLVAETTRALARCVREDGVLLDAASAAPTPPDHYGAPFAALAIAVADPADPRWRSLLARWRPVRPPARGHGPFNRLALLLLAEQLGRRAVPAPARGAAARDGRTWALAAARGCGRLRRHPSNNWLLLERACDVLEGVWHEARSAAERRLRGAEGRFDASCARWLTPARGFVDYPARLRGGPVAAPLGYHAKCTALLALVRHASPTPARERWLLGATRWLLAFVDEATGHFGGYGRSGHSLFAAACTLFVCLEALARSADDRERAGLAQRIDALCGVLEAGRRDDGLLPLTPAGKPGQGGGWDRYMHLSVYNAFAAGLLGWLCARLAEAPPRSEAGAVLPATSQDGLFLDAVAGVAACRGVRASVFLSLRGGVVQDFDAGEVDLRSAGLQPFHLCHGGRARIAPPLRVARSALRASPQLAGFTPVFQLGDALFGLARFEAAEVCADPGGRLLAFGWGVPLRLHDDPARGRGLRRWLDALDARLGASRLRRRRAVAPPGLRGHLALRAFAFDGASGRFAVATWLRGRVSAALWLNPLGHAWLGEASRPPGRIVTWSGGSPASTRAAALPATLPDAFGACGAPVPWPAHDAIWMVDATFEAPEAPVGSETARPLLHVDLERRQLVTPWRSLPLPEPPRG